jgi:hypothetical protein
MSLSTGQDEIRYAKQHFPVSRVAADFVLVDNLSPQGLPVHTLPLRPSPTEPKSPV